MADNNFQPNEQEVYTQAQPQMQYQPQPQQPPQPEKVSVGLAILSFIIPLVGLILFITKKNDKPKTAKACGICALVSFLIGVIFSATSMFSGDDTTDNNASSNDTSITLDADGDATQDTQENSNSVEAENNNNNTSNTVGDYGCVVKGAKVCKDWEGKDAVLVTYEFTNNSKDAKSFDIALDAKAYQDGVGLETAILDGDETDWLDVDIKPGVTKEVKKAYKLRDKTTPIEIEVEEYFSFSDDKIVTTIELA